VQYNTKISQNNAFSNPNSLPIVFPNKSMSMDQPKISYNFISMNFDDADYMSLINSSNLNVVGTYLKMPQTDLNNIVSQKMINCNELRDVKDLSVVNDFVDDLVSSSSDR
jgi:hypothetical protein